MAMNKESMAAGAVLGVVVGAVLVPLCVLAWSFLGHPPVAVADKPLPSDKFLLEFPLKHRIAAQAPKSVPIAVDEASLVGGAEVYRDHCAACHGYYKKPVSFAAHMEPSAPQLWEARPNSQAIGISDKPAAESYWMIANGVRLSGMPAYKQVLTDHEIWEVALLLSNADKPLPPGALSILRPSAQPELPALPGK